VGLEIMKQKRQEWEIANRRNLKGKRRLGKSNLKAIQGFTQYEGEKSREKSTEGILRDIMK
jgi:hypothetical protein